MPIDTAGLTVGELLERSRAAHRAYQSAQPRTMPGSAGAVPTPGDPAVAVAQLDDAATLRKAAEDLDPAFVDPAWDTDAAALGIAHHELMTFYAEQIARPDLADRLQRVSDAAVVESARLSGKGGRV